MVEILSFGRGPETLRNIVIEPSCKILGTYFARIDRDFGAMLIALKSINLFERG